VSDPATLTLAEARASLERREISAPELLEACRRRIEHWQARTNAFVSLEVRNKGKEGGELAGIPLAHKDMFYRAGQVSNCGSKIRKGWVASETAAVLERLDGAGALDIGALNMSEFAYGPTGHNDHWGDCRNPWQPDYITGGSSSGSGAAVAARLVFGALGSDTGGSVRLPAAACGVTGLKTTWSRVPLEGAMPLSHSLDTIGPLARSAEDCALLFRASAGPGKRGEARRLALSTAWIEQNAHPEVATAVLAAARRFGAELREIEPPPFDLLSAHCLTVMQAEASAQHAQWMRGRQQDYSSAVRVRLEAGYAIPAAQYLEVLRLRSAWLRRWREMLGEADLYLCPAIAVPIPTREETGPRGAEAARRLAEVTRLTRWVNYLGVPALVLPCGFDSRGLPIALQLVGRPFDEELLLAAGEAFQRETDWHRRSPG
jgi:aspartyl-tRNA(Asn)/glutamyl-tRNA(Gln) amidotransferase subunit A